MNVMTINNYQAIIAFDPDRRLFRGEFVGLNSGADFYAADVDGLMRKGEISLRVSLEACQRRGIEPRKHYSGKFSLRVDPDSTRRRSSLPPPTARASTNGLERRLNWRPWRADDQLRHGT